MEGAQQLKEEEDKDRPQAGGPSATQGRLGIIGQRDHDRKLRNARTKQDDTRHSHKPTEAASGGGRSLE